PPRSQGRESDRIHGPDFSVRAFLCGLLCAGGPPGRRQRVSSSRAGLSTVPHSSPARRPPLVVASLSLIILSDGVFSVKAWNQHRGRSASRRRANASTPPC